MIKIEMNTEEAGVVVDALTDHRRQALAHTLPTTKANAHERAEVCKDLITKINIKVKRSQE